MPQRRSGCRNAHQLNLGKILRCAQDDNLLMDIEIEHEGWGNLGFDTRAVIERVANASLGRAALPEPLKPETINIAFLLTSDEAVRALNRDFRGKDKPTNVLSFATLDDPDWQTQIVKNEPFHLGDIAFALETLQRESAEQKKTLHDHFTHLTVHGILHLLRYDHEKDDEAETMEALEIKILDTLGIADPYAAP